MDGWGGARTGLGLATLALALSGVVAATDGVRFSTATMSPAPVAAAVTCSAAGPYRAPEPGSTGLPPGLDLCPGGPLTVTTPGAVLDGWDVVGGIVVDATDVVVRRSRISGDGILPYGISTTPAGSVRIEDTTLTGDFTRAAVGGDRWTGERIEITGVTHDGAHLGDGARLRNSTVHSFRPDPGVTADAVVLSGTAPVLEDNRIDLGAGPLTRTVAGEAAPASVPGRGSAVLLAPDGSGERAEGPLVIRGNVLGGGRYTVAQDPSAAEPADVWITDNRFRRDAEQGPLRVSPRAVLTGNGYVDGGPLPQR